MRFLVITLTYLLANPFANAAEPAFCNPATFKNYEIKHTGSSSPSRLKVYKIGALTVAGMAIGNSKVQDVISVAETYADVKPSENYCTWYLNDGNEEAQKTFVWNYVPRPTGTNYQDMGNIYMKALGDEFDQNSVSFVSCAVNAGYIGMGCDGMRHRGPSVFAMLLAYAGCSPENAAAVATQIWGNNGIKTQMRAELGKRAAAVRAANPNLAKQLQSLMSL
jgi:hypothetical protein